MKKIIPFVSLVLFNFIIVYGQVISSGMSHTSFVCSDGTVLSTGYNSYGALGLGSTTVVNNPNQITNLHNIIAISSCTNHTIFLKSNGTVYGTGHNSTGQLGDNTTISKSTPLLIDGLNNIVKISCGASHSMFLRNDGQVFATGYNNQGQLGLGSSNSLYPSPVELNLISNVKEISCGNAQTLFLKHDGTVWATGINNLYQLGLGDNIERNAPTQIMGLSNITAIATGGSMSLFLKDDGTVYSCGSNTDGQLGLGDNTARTIPTLIPNFGNVIHIATGFDFSTFIKNDGSVYSCGNNADGQLGLGDNVNRNSPTLIAGLSNIKSAELGQNQSFFISRDLKVFACGNNIFGEFGLGNNLSSSYTVENTNLCQIFDLDKKVKGKVYFDIVQDCMESINEFGLHSIYVLIEPEDIILETNSAGIWNVDSLPAGNYTVTIDTSNTNWTVTCPITQSFTVVHPDSLTIAPSFGIVSNNPCPSPTVSVNMPLMRPCFTGQQIYVQACNEYDATGILPDAYSIVELDPNLIFENASLPFTSLGNNQYRFEHDSLYPGQCVNYTISTQVDCNTPLGLTLCLEANLYPVTDCVLDTIPTPPTGEVTPCSLPWDQSSLSVEGWCANDSIYFTITNTGQLGGGDMECYSPVRVFVDGVPYLLDSIKLLGAETFTYVFAGNGATWILEADQHPLHPGNSHPNAHVENCNPGNWTPDVVNDFPQDDADPVKDIYCGIVTGSYDPNDKKGTPYGLGAEHEVLPNQDIEYLIRFQNTGTDTAFTVVVRDTLDLDFDIFSVTSGSASHNYSFRMYGPRVLEWTFPNILLPDSTTNEVASHGFLSYRVKQKPNLADGILLTNDADIYFDFNEPIITNETSHKVQRRTFQASNSLVHLSKTKSGIKIYPNPSKQETTLSFSSYQKQVSYNLLNISGQIVLQKTNLYGKDIKVNLSEVPNGMYFMEVKTDLGTEMVKLVKE